MKSCEVFDEDNILINYLVNKNHTSKKWMIHNLLWRYAKSEDQDLLTVDAESKKVIIKDHEDRETWQEEEK